MYAVILAGGLATRLRPITERVPKSLVSVAGRPFVDYQLELLARAGVTKVLLCIGHLGQQIRDHCGDGARYGLRVAYAEDGPTQRGTGGALRNAAPLLPEVFFVLYGDAYLRCSYREIWTSFSKATTRGLMTVYENHNQYDRSNVLLEGNRVSLYVKSGRTPNMTFIDYGLSLFRKDVLAEAPSVTTFDLIDIHQSLIRKRELLAYLIHTRFYEVGSPAGLQEFDRLVREGSVVPGRVSV